MVGAASAASPPQRRPKSEDLQAAAAAEKAGRYEEAVSHYENFLKSLAESPDDAPTVVRVRTSLATDQFLLHRYDDALQVLEPVFRERGDLAAARIPAQAWVVKGLAELELNRVSAAISSLRRALGENPNSGTARLALGDALARAGDFEGAAREYREQLRLFPELADAWYKLGLVYSRLSRRTLDDLTQSKRDGAWERQLHAEVSLEQNDYLGAARTLFPAATDGAHLWLMPDTRAHLGAALLAMGYVKAAEEQFRGELSRNPESPGARFGLAEVYALRGDWPNALGLVDQLMHDQPRALRQWLELPQPPPLRDAWSDGRLSLPERLERSPSGRVWQQWLAGEPVGSLELYDESCKFPDPSAARWPGMWLKEGCYRRIASQLVAKRNLSERERIKLAESEYRLGRYDKALKQASRLLEVQPENDWGLYWLAKSYRALAEQYFSKAAASNPISARVHQALAQHYASQYKLKEAEAEFQAALRLEPNGPDLHLGLGTLYWQAGKWEKAESELCKTLELTPGSAVASYELGDTYVNMRQWEKALPHLQKATSEPSVEYRARLDLAKAEMERGLNNDALEDLSAVAQKDTDGELHYRLAMLYRKLGDKPKAGEALAVSQRLRAAAFQLDRDKMKQLEEDREAFQKLELRSKNRSPRPEN